MNLTRWQVQWCRFGVRQAIALSALTRARPNPELPNLLQQLEDLLSMSAAGHESGCNAEELRSDTLIGAIEAASILGCSPRHVRRIAADLDGQFVEGRWVFRRQAVAEYAAAKGVGSDGSRVPTDGGGAVPARAA